MQELQDFKLTDLIKIRNYFNERARELMSEYGVDEEDQPKFDILTENVKFIDKYIALDFQTIKFETTLPTYHTKESWEKATKERDAYNSQMM